MQNVSAADELVAGNHHAGDDDGDRGEDTGCGVVTRLQQIRNSELGKMPRTPRDQGHKNQSDPTAQRLPNSAGAGRFFFIRILLSICF